MKKEETVCFTGHRVIPEKELLPLMADIYRTIVNLYLKGYRNFVCGGALGFDTLAAECVTRLKERFADVRLILCLPCRDQTVKWDNINDLKKYKYLLGACDEVKYISDFYTNTCMMERNRLMVDLSNVCIAYLKREKGGTASTVKYAKKCGITVKNLAKPEGEQLSLFDDD